MYDALTHRLGVPVMPLGVTPELMCDWDWMVQRIADMHPLFEPGTKAAYISYTFGWVIGEVVRRTDPRSRQFGTFIQEEICQPLDLDSLWVGIPNAVEARVATLTNMPPIPPGAPGMAPGALLRSDPVIRPRSPRPSVRDGNACLEWLPIAFPFAEGP